MEEIQEEVVPRGDLDIDGHHLFMIASFDGNCYLVNKQSGKVYWSVPTSGFLHIANRGEDVVDYADLKPGDHKSQLYHFRSNRPRPQLIPYDTEDLLRDHFNQHYQGGVGTDVSKNEMYYLMHYQTGKIIRYFESYKKAVQNNVFENENWLDCFLIKRVDFYLHRSSPSWSLRFARIEAWFPHSRCPKSHRTECLVYHAPNPESYINACRDYKLERFPSGCALNQLIMDNRSLRLKKIELEEENKNLRNEISKLRATLTRNSRIDLPLKTNNFIEMEVTGEFFKGKYGGVGAHIEKARSESESHVRKIINRLRSSAYHPNIFLVRKSLRDYIHEPKTRYKEMSEQSIKIMRCGLFLFIIIIIFCIIKD